MPSSSDSSPEPEEPTDSARTRPLDDVPHDESQSWGVDAAIGVAAGAARLATDIAGAVGSSAPGRAAEAAARWLTRPLAREGEAVRERLGEEAVPTARRVLKQAAPNVVSAVPLEDILDSIDLDALMDRIDVNRLLDRIDIDRLLERIDVDELISRVDVAGVVSRVDVDSIVGSVDVDGVVAKVDVDAVVARVDIPGLLARIDLDQLLSRIDVAAILDRLDLDDLLSRIDLNALLERVDVDALVRTTELGALIARSTSGAASEALDAVRSQGVGLDNFLDRIVNRIARRDPAAVPAGPPLLVQTIPVAALPSADDAAADAPVHTPNGDSAAAGGNANGSAR